MTAPARPDFSALVLAGSRGGREPVASAHGVAHKALVPVAGTPMLVRVIDTLDGCPSIGPIWVSLPDPTLLDDLPGVRAPDEMDRPRPLASAATPSASVLDALDRAPPPWLVTTADHPLLTTEIVEHFLAATAGSTADVAVGLVAASTIQASHPDTRRTYLRLRGERYSGANLFALMTPAARAAARFWQRVEQERKHPWRIVRAFGLGSLLGYAFRRFTLEEAMARASRQIGIEVVAVPLPFAEAAIDVDKPEDLALVETILARRQAAAWPSLSLDAQAGSGRGG